jgi:hypothetical protein
VGKDAVESTRAIRHEKCELIRPPGVDLGNDLRRIAGSEIAEDLHRYRPEGALENFGEIVARAIPKHTTARAEGGVVPYCRDAQ